MWYFFLNWKKKEQKFFNKQKQKVFPFSCNFLFAFCEKPSWVDAIKMRIAINIKNVQFSFYSFSSSCSISLIFFSFLLKLLGRPQPEVRWLINGLPVDDQYEHNSGDVIENRLLWPAIQRSDLNSIFTCQALNTDLVEPKETSFVLDMHCKFW